MRKTNKVLKKPDFHQNKSSNQDTKVKNQIKGKQNESNDSKNADLKKQNKILGVQNETFIKQNIQPEPEDSQQTESMVSKYKRRAITSNWERYEEPEESAEDGNRGADFSELAKSRVSSSQFLQLQEEKDWLEELSDATLTVDCRRLENSLSQLPLHVRLDLPPDLAPPQEWNPESPSPKFRPFFTSLNQSLKKDVAQQAGDLNPHIKFCLPLNETPESLPLSLMDELFDSSSEVESSSPDPPPTPSPKPRTPEVCDSLPLLKVPDNLLKESSASLPFPSLTTMSHSQLPKPVKPCEDDDLDALLDLAKTSLKKQGKDVPKRNLLDEWLQKFD